MDVTYQNILARAAEDADHFSLVWRHGFEFSKSASLIMKKLNPYLVEERVTSSWPGTELFGGGKAIVRKYSVNKNSLAVLAEVPDIYSWLAPNYPEDLAFYKNGEVLFGSIAHEHEFWFNET